MLFINKNIFNRQASMVTKKTNFFSSTVLVIKVGSVIITFEIHLNGAIDVRR